MCLVCAERGVARLQVEKEWVEMKVGAVEAKSCPSQDRAEPRLHPRSSRTRGLEEGEKAELEQEEEVGDLGFKSAWIRILNK